MKKLRLSVNHIPHIKNTREHPKIKQAKKYFLMNIEEERWYKNRKIIYARSEISKDDCWIKFMFGSELYHKRMTLDMDRVKRFHWIFNILDYLNSTDPTEYDNIISIEYSSLTREVVTIDLEKEVYRIVIELPKEPSDIAIVITAYTTIKKS